MSYDCFQYYLTPYPDQKHPRLIRPTGNRPNPKSLGRGVVRGSPSPSPFADFLGVFITPLGWCLLVGVSNMDEFQNLLAKCLDSGKEVGLICDGWHVLLFCRVVFLFLTLFLFVCLFLWSCDFCLFGAMVGFLRIQGPCWCLSFFFAWKFLKTTNWDVCQWQISVPSRLSGCM